MSNTDTTRMLDDLSPENVAKIREAMTIRVSTMFWTGREATPVEQITDDSDRVVVNIGSFRHYMNCESATMLGSELLTAAVQLQAKLDLATSTAPEPDPFEDEVGA